MASQFGGNNLVLSVPLLEKKSLKGTNLPSFLKSYICNMFGQQCSMPPVGRAQLIPDGWVCRETRESSALALLPMSLSASDRPQKTWTKAFIFWANYWCSTQPQFHAMLISSVVQGCDQRRYYDIYANVFKIDVIYIFFSVTRRSRSDGSHWVAHWVSDC